TIAARPRWPARPARVLPATIDTNNVSRGAQERYFGTTSSAICGLTANTTTSGLNPAGSSCGDEYQKISAEDSNPAGTPAGSITTQRDATAADIQTRNITVPIFPQPTRTRQRAEPSPLPTWVRLSFTPLRPGRSSPRQSLVTATCRPTRRTETPDKTA